MGNHHGIQQQQQQQHNNSKLNNDDNMKKSNTTGGLESKQLQLNDKPSQLVPLERLIKILSEKCLKEEGINGGISLNIFTQCLFPRYTIVAEKLFNYFKFSSKCKKDYLSLCDFREQCEKYLTILDDDTARTVLIRIFSDNLNENQITPNNLTTLLMCTYHITMDHYSEGPQMCLTINKTLKSIVDSCFHNKLKLSLQFVTNWLQLNCPRLLIPLHRYIIHSIATNYRNYENNDNNYGNGNTDNLAAGLELATPVLEENNPFKFKKQPHLLQMSFSWLLAGALPTVFSRPQYPNSNNNNNNNNNNDNDNTTITTTTTTGIPTQTTNITSITSTNYSGYLLNNRNFLTKFLCTLPSHWIILYDSDDMGLSTNRFLHHCLNYKGPTLCLLLADDGYLFCIACPDEWRESHLYWGREESTFLQLLPKFSILENGSKMIYLNTTVRGYPHGLRIGKDPRNPLLIIDSDFNKINFKKIPSIKLLRIEVWGCGDPINREKQLEIKKWHIKEIEKQRCVKLTTSDWYDHPDRYLLELAGRPQYHHQKNQQQ